MGVAVLGLVVLAGIVGSIPTNSAPSASARDGTIVLSTIEWKFAGPVHCFNTTSSVGLAISAGSDFTVSLALSYPTGTTGHPECTVTSESVGTEGFALVGSNTPLVVGSNGEQVLSVQLTAPDRSETTALSLDGTAALTNQTNSSTRVIVTQVHWIFTGTSHCVNETATNGTTVGGGDVFTESVSIRSTGSVSCTIDSEASGTSNFTYVESNTPLTVSSGSRATLSVEIRAPSWNVTTALDLDGSVSPSNRTTRVNVTAVNWDFSGSTSCFNDTTGTGGTVDGGSNLSVSVPISFTGPAGSSCTVSKVTSNTSGFSVDASNTPLVVPTGSTQTLSATVGTPARNETTVLTLLATVNESEAATRVNLTSVDWNFSGPSNCWGDLSTKGKVVTGGSEFNVTISLSYTAGLLDPDSCTVASASVGTPGFTFVGANTPLVVDSGSTETLRVTLLAPTEDESLVLTIDGVVTSP